MESTHLNLLTRDGALAVTFTPGLSQEHYSELHDIVRDCESAKELRESVSTAAERWSRKVSFE